MPRHASDSLNPDNFPVSEAIERGRQQQREAEAMAARMTEDARREREAHRDEARPFRGGKD